MFISKLFSAIFSASLNFVYSHYFQFQVPLDTVHSCVGM